TTNAHVTIPLEVQKQIESERGLSGNVLEAAMLSLQVYPDPKVQAHVNAAVQTMRSRSAVGNSGFEVAATYYNTTGRPALRDRATAAARALYDDFTLNDRPLSGGDADPM